jgi:hypothetical protein
MSKYTPNPGFEWNPLRAYRNVPCPCGSGKKAKRCHGKIDCVPQEMAEFAAEYLARLKEHGFIK